jgi:plastocyanin
MTSRPLLRSVLLAGVLVLALAGCGNDTAKESTAPPAGGAGTGQIAVQGFAFKPEKATVKAGTKVTWTFKDDAAHNVVPAAGAAEPTKSPDLKSGGTYDFTFTKAGTFEYICGIHEYMTGTVEVTP